PRGLGDRRRRLGQLGQLVPAGGRVGGAGPRRQRGPTALAAAGDQRDDVVDPVGGQALAGVPRVAGLAAGPLAGGLLGDRGRGAGGVGGGGLRGVGGVPAETVLQ